MTYLFTHLADVAALAGQHLALVVTALAIALAIALPLGIVSARNERIGTATLGILGAIYAIPSLALLVLFVPILGLGFWTAVVALVAYAQMLLVRNVAVGLRSVPAAQIEAAKGMGMTSLQRLVRVELPYALPIVVGGLRIATISLIAIATVAAFINAGGLGTLIFAGIHQDDPQRTIAGSIGAATLAILADLAFRSFERRLIR